MIDKKSQIVGEIDRRKSHKWYKPYEDRQSNRVVECYPKNNVKFDIELLEKKHGIIGRIGFGNIVFFETPPLLTELDVANQIVPFYRAINNAIGFDVSQERIVTLWIENRINQSSLNLIKSD